VTPLKDRIGSQIFTHYPKSVALARAITEQEARISPEDQAAVLLSETARNLLEEVSFVARSSEYVDAKSGVSARLSISALENLVAAGKLRLIESGASTTRIRLVDFVSIVPSITGKIELVYEGEQEGADEVAKILIDQAVVAVFERMFPRLSKLEKPGTPSPYAEIVTWFDTNLVELNYTDSDEAFEEALLSIKPLQTFMDAHGAPLAPDDRLFCMEVVLWALSVGGKLERTAHTGSYQFESPLMAKYLR
jgi:magnesium chelatase subunit I